MLLKSTGSLVEALEIHRFTGTHGTRPNAAPVQYLIWKVLDMVFMFKHQVGKWLSWVQWIMDLTACKFSTH